MAFWNKSTTETAEEFSSSSSLVKTRAPAAQKRLLGILRRSVITEKSSAMAEKNKFMFVVADDANKREVKGAVESRFGVRVTDVHMNRLPRKMRRRGRTIGWRAGIKKATVTLAEGDKIELT